MEGRRDVKREYGSPLREAQAQSTRREIVAAAGRLFAAVGYAATSVEQIAAEAGVSRATVFAAVGGKPQLLKEAYDVALAGDDAPVAIVDRPENQAILADPDQRRLIAGFVAFAVPAGARIAGIYEALHGAAGADPEARRLWDEVRRERRVGMENIARALAAMGPLREGVDETTASEILYALGDPWLYHLLVEEQGWTLERFRDWMTRSLQEQLLEPGGQA